MWVRVPLSLLVFVYNSIFIVTKKYYDIHLRSLFLSKFLLFSPLHITRLKMMVLKLGFKKNNFDYNVALLFLFYVSQIFPLHSIKFSLIRRRKKLKF